MFITFEFHVCSTSHFCDRVNVSFTIFSSAAAIGLCPKLVLMRYKLTSKTCVKTESTYNNHTLECLCLADI